MDPTKEFFTLIACVVLGIVFLVNITRWVSRDREVKKRMIESSDTILIKKDVLIKLLAGRSNS